MTLALGFFMVTFAVIVMVLALRDWPPKEQDMAAAAMFTFWGVVIFVVSLRSLRHGRTYLRIDQERGTLTYVEEHLERETIAIIDLGELYVDDHKLRAANLPNRVLFASPLLLDVEQQRARLERLVGMAQIRLLLSLDAPDEGVYRDDPTLAFKAQQLIPNLVRLREVLAALGGDPRVVALWTAIDRSLDRDRNV